ncbi:MAG: NAD nucleotidase, partial [Sulfurovum sp.]|nr:NAD nucleotidase [Sulfurovum sp.]
MLCKKWFLVVGMAVLSMGLTGCIGDDEEKAPLSLSIFHVNDTHSHIDSEQMSFYLDGNKTYYDAGGYARIVTKIKELRESKANSLTLNAGDVFQGTLYYSLFKGEADAEAMNMVGFDAYVLGNHSFDDGDNNLKTFLDRLNETISVVAANVVPEAGNVLEGMWKPYVIKEVDGQKVGIVGITISGKTKNSSNPSDDITFLNELETAQKYIDELKEEGVNKVILLTHQGYNADLDMAKGLFGVDVIVGGDSHTYLGDFGIFASSSGEYPTKVEDKDGNQVCVVQAGQYAKILGNLDIEFDAEGKVTSCSGNPILLMGDTFLQKNTDGVKVDANEITRQKIQDLIENNRTIEIVEEDNATSAIVKRYKDKVDEEKAKVIGQAAASLRHIRIPGVGYGDTNGSDLPLGSEIAPIVAKSFYDLSNKADACIQNAGGVRITVPAGDITMATAYELLPFANTLFEIEMKGSEVKQVLEDALGNYMDNGGSTGSFPYAYALRYDVKTDKAYGQRVQNLEIKDRETGQWSAIGIDKMYVIVTNSYIASGKDGYTTFKTVQEERGAGVDTYLDYAMSFVRYVESRQEAGESVEILPASEHCIKSYGTSTDFRVTPYVQNPAKDAMTVMWLSNSDQSGTLTVDGRSLSSTAVKSDDLAYHPSEIESFFIENTKPPYLHKIRVDGLVEGTTYTYKVMQNGSEFNSSFGTSPSEDSNISFIVYADSETEP